jgi:hypothetical protein
MDAACFQTPSAHADTRQDCDEAGACPHLQTLSPQDMQRMCVWATRFVQKHSVLGTVAALRAQQCVLKQPLGTMGVERKQAGVSASLKKMSEITSKKRRAATVLACDATTRAGYAGAACCKPPSKRPVYQWSDVV